jgi:hypothetical protein
VSSLCGGVLCVGTPCLMLSSVDRSGDYRNPHREPKSNIPTRRRDLCGKNVISGQHRRNVPFGYLPDGDASHLFHRLSVDGGN